MSDQRTLELEHEVKMLRSNLKVATNLVQEMKQATPDDRHIISIHLVIWDHQLKKAMVPYLPLDVHMRMEIAKAFQAASDVVLETLR